MSIKKFGKPLGELEEEIMEIVWKLKSASVRDVLAVLEKKRKIAYTTVMTVMARLCQKGILQRKMNGHDAYIYKPVQCKEKFLSSASKNIISHLIKEFGEDMAVAQFIDVLESANIKKSRQWRQRLREIIK